MLVKYGLMMTPPEKTPNAPATISFVSSGSTAMLGSELALVSALSLDGITSTTRSPVTSPMMTLFYWRRRIEMGPRCGGDPIGAEPTALRRKKQSAAQVSG